MRFGFFDDKNFEYVISRPDTPLPWINYLGTEHYFGIISNTAGGYSFYKDARLRRITRYRYNNAPLDQSGRYIYIRDNGAKKPDFWSPTWQPTQKKLDSYECRHGLGYTQFKSVRKGIKASIKYFVPLRENLEIWELVVTNHRSSFAELSIFSAVEFCLWDAVDDANNYQRNYSIGEVEVVDGVIYHTTEYRERRNHFAFFACSLPLAGFDTQREDFLGAYRGWAAPLAVEQGSSKDSLAAGWQPIGSHHVKLDLQPGETQKVIFLLGYHENPAESKFDPPDSTKINTRIIRPVIDRYTLAENVDRAFTELKSFWRNMLERFSINTPDVHTNRMVNIWNVYQMMVTYNLSRSASYFETGTGRGIGFRDSNQDLLGFMYMMPERARERILDLAATQLPDGGAYHQYQPLTKLGNNDIGSGFYDDPLWLVLSVSAYLKETGDWSILDQPVPFNNQAGSEKPLYGHLRLSMTYTQDRLGPHGLPLIGRADWNDCLNLNSYSKSPGHSFQTVTTQDGKTAESVLIAGLYIMSANEMELIAKKLGCLDDADQYANLRQIMERAIDTTGWDGDWYLRAYDNEGHPVGSRSCNEGSIYIEPQGICVMAGIGLKDDKARKALDSVKQLLANEHGIALLHPAYQRYHLELGEISSYPPGYKENGSVFCHTNPWVMIAETMIGRGDQAMDYYRRINPSFREEISEIHRCEPYVYSQMIGGPEAVKPGEAKNSWLTGTASWNYVAITQYILGIRPTFDGMLIDPCIPSAWERFSASRLFRGKTWRITVYNPLHVNSGVTRMLVNQKEISGNLIPVDLPQDILHVEVWLGGKSLNDR